MRAMRAMLSKTETVLLAACAALLALAVFGPPWAGPSQPHGFADGRTLFGLPFALDVLSNLPFLLAGLAGFVLLWRTPPGCIGNMQRAMAELFFAGLVLVAFASGWYHLHPDDAGLAIDRYAMAIAFAGLLGLAAAGRVSERAGTLLGLALLVLGPLAVRAWAAGGNLLPWAVLQFGGMLLLLALAAIRPQPGALPVRWFAVLAAYGVAKLAEGSDHAIFAATGEWLSGHTIKHIVAAMAAIPVLIAIRRAGESGQNVLGISFAKELGVRITRRA
jgi:hypothetical protein